MQQLEDFKRKNEAKYKIKELGLFGSFAKDKATAQSDIDICVKSDNIDLFVFVHLKEDLEEILGKKVDLIRLRETMNVDLKSKINKEAIFV